MAIDFEHAVTFARSLGAEFSVEALTSRFGGSKRENGELAQRVKIRLAEDAAGTRLKALEAGQIPDRVSGVIKVIVEALGEATLKLEDALQAEHDHLGRTIANAVAAAERQWQQEKVELERSRGEVSEQLSAAQERVRELEKSLSLANKERDDLLLGNSELAKRVDAERKRADEAGSELIKQRCAAETEREQADRARRREERLSAEALAKDDLVRRQDAEIERLHALISRLALPADRTSSDGNSAGLPTDGGHSVAVSSADGDQHGGSRAAVKPLGHPKRRAADPRSA